MKYQPGDVVRVGETERTVASVDEFRDCWKNSYTKSDIDGWIDRILSGETVAFHPNPDFPNGTYALPIKDDWVLVRPALPIYDNWNTFEDVSDGSA